MALIDLDACLGPTEFVCPARATVEVGVPSISLLLRKLLFLHPTGVDAPLDARVRRVLRQQRLLPGAAAWATVNSVRVGTLEMIVQPVRPLVQLTGNEMVVLPTDEDGQDSRGIPVEAFSGVGGLSSAVLNGVVAPAGKRIGFTFRNHSDKNGRLRFAVLVTRMANLGGAATPPHPPDGGPSGDGT